MGCSCIVILSLTDQLIKIRDLKDVYALRYDNVIQELSTKLGYIRC